MLVLNGSLCLILRLLLRNLLRFTTLFIGRLDRVGHGAYNFNLLDRLIVCQDYRSCLALFLLILGLGSINRFCDFQWLGWYNHVTLTEGRLPAWKLDLCWLDQLCLVSATA